MEQLFINGGRVELLREQLLSGETDYFLGCLKTDNSGFSMSWTEINEFTFYPALAVPEFITGELATV